MSEILRRGEVDRAQWQEQDFRVNGYRLHARLRRQPAGLADQRPVLVFLHEALGSIAMWKDVPERLADLCGCHALVYDRLGHGASEPLPEELARHDYLYREAGEFLPQLLAAAGVGQAVLIGHSDGGTIALLAAAKFPQQISAVVAEAAHVLVEDCTLQGIRATIGSPDVLKLKASVARYHQQDIGPLFKRWEEVWLSEPFADWNMEQLLVEISSPVLVIQGDRDQFGSLCQVETILAGVAGHAESLLLPDCGHIPHFEDAESYLQQIRTFLRQQKLVCN